MNIVSFHKRDLQLYSHPIPFNSYIARITGLSVELRFFGANPTNSIQCIITVGEASAATRSIYHYMLLLDHDVININTHTVCTIVEQRTETYII